MMNIIVFWYGLFFISVFWAVLIWRLVIMKKMNIKAITISNRQKTKINAAWHTYCHQQENKDELNFDQYSYKASGKTKKDIIHLKSIALERIEKIIKSAE